MCVFIVSYLHTLAYSGSYGAWPLAGRVDPKIAARRARDPLQRKVAPAEEQACKFASLHVCSEKSCLPRACARALACHVRLMARA